MLTALVAIVGGLIPTLLYVVLLWWLDRYEKEPGWLLAMAFFWGAVPAALLAVILELLLDLPLSAWGGEGVAANLISASISAPLVEESLKGIALVGLVLAFRREFDGVLDGIIYGAMIGLGFALTENVFAYYLPIASAQGLQAGAGNLLMRSVVFGLNHAFWTGILGAAVGYTRQARGSLQRLFWPVVGWVVAVLFHSIHNVGATLSEQTACLSLGVSLIIDWGGILMLLAIALLFLRKESRWIERGLGEEVQRGILADRDFQVLRSASQRVRRRWAALGRGGWGAYRLLGRYSQCATELAFKKQRMRSFGDEGGTVAEIQRLREELASLRAQAEPWL
jgi:RsiW-degrading membrane proteinase PrsW (M82 family)